MTKLGLVHFLCLAILGGLVLEPTLGADAVVVRPSTWQSALVKWKTHREAQGFEIAEIDAEIGRDAIRSKIIELDQAEPGKLRFVVLASDVGASATINIPTFYHPSTAMVQFGGDPTIATDNPYGDLDSDGIPDLAVGRIPADSASQLEDVLDRILQYESNPDFSSWRRDVHVVAGVGGFGAVADSVIEMTTRRFLADRIPGWSQVSVTQASTGSNYCPDPWRFSECCIDRMNQGGMFWVYIGHGHVKTLDYIRAKDEYLPILNHRHVPAVATGQQPPIAVFLACYTGAFDALEDSLAEQLVLKDQGPVAAIAASRVSGPYGLAMLSHGMLHSFYQTRRSTLGEILLDAKRGMLSMNAGSLVAKASAESHDAATDQNPFLVQGQQLQLIDAIATAMSPKEYDLGAERLEHVWQVQLIGDPMLSMSHPHDLQLRTLDQAVPGQEIEVEGVCEVAGTMTIEFAYRRDQSRKDLRNWAAELDSETGRENFQQRYHAANQRVLQTVQWECKQGEFCRPIQLPEDLARGKYCVRAFVEGKDGWEVGYTEINVRPPR